MAKARKCKQQRSQEYSIPEIAASFLCSHKSSPKNLKNATTLGYIMHDAQT
jgi:hypothetical protein